MLASFWFKLTQPFFSLSSENLISKIFPSEPKTCLNGSSFSLHQITSVWSPNVQTINIPVPFSLSTNSLGKIGIGAKKTGDIAFFPNKSLYLLSSGCAVMPTHAANSSGLVVEIIRSCFESSIPNLRSW